MTRSLEIPDAAMIEPNLAEGSVKVSFLETTTPTSAQKVRRRALVVPREHGAWGMLLVPLATGAAIGLVDGGRILPVLLLTTLVLALFWLRTPAESWLGTSAVRPGSRDERRLILQAMLPLVAIAATSATALFWPGKNLKLLPLGVFAGVAFAVQAFLKRMGRTTRVAAELVGALALTSTAPAAYYVATGQLDSKTWALWLLNWLFAADQIHFVWLRIRGARSVGWSEKVAIGWTFVVGQFFLLGILIAACPFGWLPLLTLIAFGPILLRGFAWFAMPSKPIVVRRLGWTELAHALAFGALLTTAFIFGR